MAKDENNAQGSQEGEGKKDAAPDIYEPEEPKKIIRFITVVSYLCSVSFMGVALSAYYLFLWEPPNPRLIQRTHHLSADPQAESLIGEPRLNSNDSDETYSEYIPSNLLDDSLYPRNDEGDSQKSIRDRKIYDNFPEDAPINNQTKLNATLVPLRTSLIDILKGNRADVNDTHSIDDDETKKTYEKVTGNAKVSSDSSLTVDVPLRTISGSESSLRINHLAHNSLAPTDFTHGTVESPVNTVSPPINRRKKKFHRREAPNDPGKTDDSTSLRDKITLPHKKKYQVQEADQAVPPGWQASSPKLISIAITYGGVDSSKMQLPRKMSAQNVMASISRSLGNREQKAAAGNEVRFAGDERKDKLYEPKHKQKLVRVLTVVAYVIFVSMAAILLSLYYTFLWDPKDPMVKVRVRSDCANVKMLPSTTSSAMTNDTQIDTGTKPSMMEDYQSGESEASSTRTEMNIPTTLADSVLFGRIYSTTTWSDSEYTQSSSTPETIENNATEESIVYSID